MEGNGKDSGEACVVDRLGVVVGVAGRGDGEAKEEPPRKGIWPTNGANLPASDEEEEDEDAKVNVHTGIPNAGGGLVEDAGDGGGAIASISAATSAAAAAAAAAAGPIRAAAVAVGGSRATGSHGVAITAVGDDGGSWDNEDDDDDDDEDDEDDEDEDEDNENDEEHCKAKTAAAAAAARVTVAGALSSEKTNVATPSAKGKEKVEDGGGVKPRPRKRKDRSYDGDGDEAEEMLQQTRMLPAPGSIPYQPPALTWTSTAVNSSPPSKEHALVQAPSVTPQKPSTAIVPLPHVTTLPVAGNGTEHNRRRRYTPRATPLTNEAVMELIKAKRAETKRSDALPSGSTVRMQPQPSRWCNIVHAMTAAGHPGMEAEKLRKKWNNLCGAFRKVSEYEKVPGNKSFWLLTPAEKREKEVDVSIARSAYEAMAEFMSDRRGSNPCCNPELLRLRDTPYPQPQTLAPVGDPPEDGGGVGEVEGAGTRQHTQGEATEGSTPGSVAGNVEEARNPNSRKRKLRPAATSLNNLTSAFRATMKDLTTLMDKQAEAKRACIREQREGMIQQWTQQATAMENQTNTIMNAILSTGRELAAAIASVAAAIGSLHGPPAAAPQPARPAYESTSDFDAVYGSRPRAEAWTTPGSAYEAPMGAEWQPSQPPSQ